MKDMINLPLLEKNSSVSFRYVCQMSSVIMIGACNTSLGYHIHKLKDDSGGQILCKKEYKICIAVKENESITFTPFCSFLKIVKIYMEYYLIQCSPTGPRTTRV